MLLSVIAGEQKSESAGPRSTLEQVPRGARGGECETSSSFSPSTSPAPPRRSSRAAATAVQPLQPPSAPASRSPDSHAVLISANMPSPPNSVQDGRKVVRVVFTALLIDLLAFTMPCVPSLVLSRAGGRAARVGGRCSILVTRACSSSSALRGRTDDSTSTRRLPLFPRIMEDFVRQEALDPSSSAPATLLSRTMSLVRTLRAYLFSFAAASSGGGGDSRWDLTLLGGLLASLFSFCQFVVSPYIGRLADRYGRRTVLLCTMVGNLVSALLWLVAARFEVYALSRVVGGLSEGNVQLSIACITDVTTPEQRARALALVGAAFSLAFTAGPSLGAYLSQRAFGPGSVVDVPVLGEVRLNAYAVPAAMTVVLLAFETAYLWACLPETRGWTTTREDADGVSTSTSTSPTSSPTKAEPKPDSAPAFPLPSPSSRLAHLSTTHLLFLFCFSGAEFTLTFLTHALFAFSNAQNGRLLGFVGLVSAALSGGVVRRLKGTTAGSARLAQRGMGACAGALALLALLPGLAAHGEGEGATAATALLWAAAALLAFVSASVVTSLSALASAAASSPSYSSGASSSSSSSAGAGSGSAAALGTFRSQGQLGRALGPLVFTALWWVLGPAFAYALGAAAVRGVARRMGGVVREEEGRERERERAAKRE